MSRTHLNQVSGNRCGHDPLNPRFVAISPPLDAGDSWHQFLALVVELTRKWFFSPESCPQLEVHPKRRSRSERREACLNVLETILRHLDPVTLCLGASTPEGFLDLNVKTIALEAGLGLWRCERALSRLKVAGFIKVWPRRQSPDRGQIPLARRHAIRSITSDFFRWLGLELVLERERARRNVNSEQPGPRP